jgi:RHS repeat-associated protein
MQSDPFGTTFNTSYYYDRDGAVVVRNKVGPGGGMIAQEQLHTSYRELLWKYVDGDPATAWYEEWRYRYNPQGVRESKRMTHFPISDGMPGNSWPWVYYLLGGSGEQLAIYHGAQDSGDCGVGRRTVRFYADAYNTVTGGITRLTTRLDAANAAGRKEYRVEDHIGSTRMKIDEGGGLIGSYDYEPFGRAVTGEQPREGYIGKENDRESGLTDLGVRKYDPEIGRFLSTDPLWEKHHPRNPYHYALNDPMRYSDVDGLDSTERAQAIRKAQEYIEKKGNSKYKMGAKGGPGTNVDCSGLVSNCIRAAGLPDPVGQGKGTGVQQLEQGSNPTPENMIEPGNLVTFRTGGWGFHVGIIESVNRSDDGNVQSFTMIHSSSSAKGPTRDVITPGGDGYLESRVHGYWKWDSPEITPVQPRGPMRLQSVPTEMR